MSFLTIEAALANIFTSSKKSRFFKASLSMLLIPSLKTKIVFFFRLTVLVLPESVLASVPSAWSC